MFGNPQLVPLEAVRRSTDDRTTLRASQKSDLSAQWAPASALARISTTAYDAVKGTLIRSYCNKNEISRETVKSSKSNRGISFATLKHGFNII